MASKGRGGRASDIANELSNFSAFLNVNVKDELRYHHRKLISLTILLRLRPHVSHDFYTLLSYLVILLQRRISESPSLYRAFVWSAVCYPR
jgi:hypothetical protein